MILQVLLTIVFGFGVLTLATVALLNTAGHRLFEGERLGFVDGQVQFAFRYPTDEAETLRRRFARLPLWLGWAGGVAVVFTAVLYFSTGPQPQLAPGEPDASHLKPGSIITWTTMGLYVLWLVAVTAVLSRGVYTVLKNVEQVDEAIALNDAMAQKLYAKIGKLVVKLDRFSREKGS